MLQIPIIDITILETGGTINGILSPEEPAPDASRVIPYLLARRSEFGANFSYSIVTMKDSRAIDEPDREALAKAIADSSVDRILVPHGTFTMAETGRYLQMRLGDSIGEKSVVLVGALVPLHDEGSDAPANLEYAVTALRDDAPAGIRVAMNNTLWDPRQVRKDPETGEFVKR